MWLIRQTITRASNGEETGVRTASHLAIRPSVLRMPPTPGSSGVTAGGAAVIPCSTGPLENVYRCRTQRLREQAAVQPAKFVLQHGEHLPFAEAF